MAFSSSPRGSVMINVTNLVAFIANLVITYGVGTMGLFGAATNADLSEKYQTLITPIGWAFSIWAVIFLAQFIWCIVQLLPAFRGDALVMAVGWNYVLVCVAQIGWTISFSMEIIWLSLICMLAILFFLVRIVRAQGDSDLRGYIILKFPFSIHTGWIVAASFVNISVLLVSLQVSAQIQFYVAMASLSLILIIAGALTFDIVILLVFAWALVGIYIELRDPNDVILNTFVDYSYIKTVQTWSLIALFVILAITACRAFSAFRNSRGAARNTSDEGGYRTMDKSDV